MSSPEKTKRFKWGKAEWTFSVLSVFMMLLVSGVWPVVLERMFKSHLLAKTQEKRSISEPRIVAIPSKTDENGLVPPFVVNGTYFYGMDPAISVNFG